MSSKADVSGAVVWLGRVGLAARGIVYLTVGGLAVMAGLGLGSGKVADQREAVRALGSSPLGGIVLWIIGLGLAAYVFWRFSHVVTGGDADKNDEAKRWRKRVVALISSIAYAGLSVTAFTQALGGSSRRSGGSGQEEGAAWLMQQPLGRWLVGLVGAAILGAAVYQFTRAITAGFSKHLRGGELSATQETWIRRAGRAGFASRGVAFSLIGWFFLRAAFQSDASEAGGLGAALHALAGQPPGPILLLVVGAGLGLFGLYSLIEARYRQIR